MQLDAFFLLIFSWETEKPLLIAQGTESFEEIEIVLLEHSRIGSAEARTSRAKEIGR